MRATGFEPVRLSTRNFKSRAATYFATPARMTAMKHKLTGLWKHPTNGTYFYRRAVPSRGELRTFIGRNGMYQVPLGTKSNEQAVRLWTAEHDKYEKLVEFWTKQLSQKDRPRDDLIDRMVAFVIDWRARRGGTLIPMDLGDSVDMGTLWNGLVEYHGRQGLPAPEESLEGWEELVRVYNVVRVAADQNIRLRPDPVVPLAPEVAATPAKPRALVSQKQHSLTEIKDIWVASKQANKKPLHPRTIKEAERNIKSFIAANGNIPAQLITSEHAMAFAAELDKRSDNSPNNKHKAWRYFSAIFKPAIKRRLLTANPLGLSPYETVKRVQRREELTDSELQTLFGHRFFTGTDRGYFGDAMYWMWIMGIYTGMRPGEGARLAKADVQQISIPDGTLWTINVKPGKDDLRINQIKTDRSERRIPIPARMIELGFVEFVTACKTPRLFPAIKPGTNGDWTANTSAPLNKMLRDVGIKHPAKTNYSTRHSFISKARDYGVSDEHRDAITGQVRPGVAPDYGRRVSAVFLKASIDKVRYDVVIPRWVPAT